MLNGVKEQCHEILVVFFKSKNSIGAPYEQAKTVAWNFPFSQRYSQKMCVRIVNDYADTVSA